MLRKGKVRDLAVERGQFSTFQLLVHTKAAQTDTTRHQAVGLSQYE